MKRIDRRDHASDTLPHGSVHAYVLAGGKSERMGRDKAALVLEGQPLARRLAERWGGRVEKVWLVTKLDSGLEHLGIPMLYDRDPDRALVHGVRAVLAAPGPTWRLVLGCDMPAVTTDVLDDLWRTAIERRAPGCAPLLPGRKDPEPLPSLWHARLAQTIQTSWGRTARGWVRRAGLAVWVVPEARATRFDNVNTPEDWRGFRARSSEEVVG